MNENQLAREIVDAAYQIHSKLGPGLFESVYEVVLSHELEKRGLVVERQKTIPIRYDKFEFDEGFRADIVVENSVIICPEFRLRPQDISNASEASNQVITPSLASPSKVRV